MTRGKKTVPEGGHRGDGYINLCLAVLNEAKKGNTQMWRDFSLECDIAKRNWMPLQIAYWVSNWWHRDLAGQIVYKAEEPMEFDKGDVKRYDESMAKYNGLRKLERNKALVEYALAHPELSQAEIGKAFNLQPSRVSRILSAHKKRIERLKNANR